MRTYKTTNENEFVKVTYFVADEIFVIYAPKSKSSDSKEDLESILKKGEVIKVVAMFEVDGEIVSHVYGDTIEEAIEALEKQDWIKVVKEDTLDILNGDDEEAKDKVAPIVCETQKGDLVYVARADSGNWYINFNTGLGFGKYPKKDWTLGKALQDDNF